jgi:hypothetical protein
VPSPIGGPALFLPGPAEELVYLAVHAAAHRFSRIGWLVDVQRLLERLTAAERAQALELARSWGFEGPFSAAMLLVEDHLGVAGAAPPRRMGVRVAAAFASEPAAPWKRTVTRLLYSLLLADSNRARGRYVSRTLVDRLVHGIGEDA